MDQVAEQSRNAIRDRIVSDNIWKTVVWLSLPSVATQILQNAYSIIDGKFLASIGAPALAGVGVANQVFMVLTALANAVMIGATALVARFVGAGDTEEAEHAVRQSLILTAIVAAAMGLVAIATGYPIMRVIVHNADGYQQASIYLSMLLIGLIPTFLMLTLTGIYRGLGDMMTPLIAMGVMTVLSIAGDWLLIFGIGPFPRMGVAGAGISYIVSRTVAMIIYLGWLPRTHLGKSLRGSWRPAWSWWKRVLNIGTPAFAQGILRTVGSMMYYGILGRSSEGLNALAALTIGLRMEGIAFMPGLGFSIAATSMVGQNLGAKKPDRAERGAWAATWLGMLTMGVTGMAFVVFSRQIAGAFTSDVKVIPLAASYLVLNGLTEWALALNMILTGALQGAGETRFPTIVSVVTMWFIRLPLTYYLALTLHMASLGAWIGMSGSTLLSGLGMLLVFRRSSWKDRRI